MAFSNYYKQICQFGRLIGQSSPVLGLPDDERITYKDYSGNTVYFPKHMPFLNYTEGARKYNMMASATSGSSLSGWIFSTDTVDDGETISNLVVGSLVTSSTSAPTFRVSVTNNGNSPIVLKSLVFIYNNSRMPSASTGTGFTDSKMIEIYYNLPTTITVPANDSVFVDITLESGDVRSVNVVENR